MRTTLSHNLAPVMKGVTTDLTRATTATADEITEGLKNDLRAQVTNAGLGTRLANTWRGQRYPKGRESLNAAAFVYSKAPDIIDAFDSGASIVPVNGKKYLAIPTENVPPRSRGGGFGGRGLKMNPFEVETAFNQDLKFIKSKKGTLLAVVSAIAGRRGGFRAATRTRTRQGRNAQQIIMFILVPAVKEPKKFDLDSMAGKWAREVENILSEKLT